MILYVVNQNEDDVGFDVRVYYLFHDVNKDDEIQTKYIFNSEICEHNFKRWME